MGRNIIHFSPIFYNDYIMLFNVGKSLRNTILNSISQEQAFAHYLNISEEDVRYCLKDRSNKINNPLRKDENPSLGFMYTNSGKLIMKDFARSIFSGDIFDLVGIVLNKDTNSPKQFIEICDHIQNSIIKNKNIATTPVYTEIIKESDYAKKLKIIKYTIRNWNSSDTSYWSSMGITTDYLNEEGVFPISTLWINDKLVYYYKQSDPAYVYYFGKDEDKVLCKVYFPNRNKTHGRFITNHSLPLDAYNELYKPNKILILIKSKKDKLVLKRLLNRDDVTIIPMSHESVRLTKNLVDVLYKLFEKIVIFTDYDFAGLSCGYYHKMLYDIPCFYLGRPLDTIKMSNSDNREVLSLNSKLYRLTGRAMILNDFYNFVKEHENKFDVKDVSDYVVKYGVRKAKRLTKIIYNNCNLYEIQIINQ